VADSYRFERDNIIKTAEQLKRPLAYNLMLYAAVMTVCVCGQGCSSQHRSPAPDEHAKTLAAHHWQSRVGDTTGIWISVKHQQLRLIENYRIVNRYPCSTAKAGIGSTQDSAKTPLGWHRIGAKIGDRLPPGAVLKDRQWTGRLWTAGQTEQEDLILSRILRLEGLEDGKNRGGSVDSWNRYIYIHGTNRIDELGRPASGGCIRLDPHTVIDLYDRVNENWYVLITKE
jgi:hypothetical protein